MIIIIIINIDICSTYREFGLKRALTVTYAPREKILGRVRIWSKQESLCNANS